MAIIQRALFTWFIVLVFLILMVLRLDKKVSWNWFLVFIPMWVFDAVVIIYITFKMIVHCKNGYDHRVDLNISLTKKGFYMAAVLLKLSFQVLLCMRLQYYPEIDLKYVMIPFWILMSKAIYDVFMNLVQVARTWSTYHTCALSMCRLIYKCMSFSFKVITNF